MNAPIIEDARIILLRHGETEWSRDFRHTSRTDLALTERGEAQAALLAKALAGVSYGPVLTSPRLRARRTAELAGLIAEIDADLAEWDYGEYEGRRSSEIRQERPGWYLWRDGAPGGETARDVGTRVDRVLSRARASMGERHSVVLIGHAHCLRVLTARWLELPPENGRLFRLDTATISILGIEHGRPVILRWNAEGGAG
jgi:probable phosphoglycerate mutase